MVITDRHDHVIDDKNRLAIPSQIRNAMDPERDGSGFYLVQEERYMQLIPEKLFERYAEQTPTGLMPAPEVARVRRFLYAQSSKLDPDKQGRVILPDRFMKDSKSPDPFAKVLLDREVTLVGNGDRIDLWNRGDFAAHMRETVADRLGIQATLQKMFGSAPSAPAVGGTASN